MKKFIIIILILSLLIVFGCTKIIPLGTVSITAETPQTVIKTITNTVTVEDTAKITELQNEVTKY